MNIKETMQQVRPFSAFSHWFVKHHPKNWTVYEINSGSVVGIMDNSGKFHCKCEDLLDVPQKQQLQAAVELQFADFQIRPEYYVSESFPVDANDFDSMVTVYNLTLLGIALIRARKGKVCDVDDKSEKLSACFDWLERAGFYQGPSSTQYHDAFTGGNLYHTLKVMNYTKELWTLPTYAKRVKIEDAVLVAATHDWCKIDAYEPYQKKLPNPKTGNWEPTTCWKYKDNLMPLGHGVSSMFLASKFFRLTNVEALAIRWHMGAYRCVESETYEMYQAVEKYPLVLMLQIADQLATTSYPDEGTEGTAHE